MRKGKGTRKESFTCEDISTWKETSEVGKKHPPYHSPVNEIRQIEGTDCDEKTRSWSRKSGALETRRGQVGVE